MDNVNNFRIALKFVLDHEGGYVNDPSDPGGETKWGISKRSYPQLDIANLSREQAIDIYSTDYWDAANCDCYGTTLSVAAFDTAVNCGVARTLGWIDSGGCRTVDSLLARRRDYYVDLINKNTNLMKFARGWWNRMSDLKKLCDSLTDDDENTA